MKQFLISIFMVITLTLFGCDSTQSYELGLLPINISDVTNLQTSLNAKASLTGVEELTNKTLTSSVAKGTWSRSGTWGIPAFNYNTGNVSGIGWYGTTFYLDDAFTGLPYNRIYYRDSGTIGTIFDSDNKTYYWQFKGITKMKLSNTSRLDMESSGGGYYDPTTHSWIVGSSSEFKDNITDLDINKAYSMLDGLLPKEFNWKQYIEPVITKDGQIITDGYWVTNPNSNKKIGFIAEDLNTIGLDSMTNEKSTGYDPVQILAILVKIVKQQQLEIEILKGVR